MVFVAFLFVVTPVEAQETGPLFSGAYLLKLCERDENGNETIPKGHAACQAYIAGVVDYQDMLRSLGTRTSVDMCVPNTVKMNDLQDVVWKYLEINAQHDNFGAAPAVGLALSAVFPCKE